MTGISRDQKVRRYREGCSLRIEKFQEINEEKKVARQRCCNTKDKDGPKKEEERKERKTVCVSKAFSVTCPCTI